MCGRAAAAELPCKHRCCEGCHDVLRSVAVVVQWAKGRLDAVPGAALCVACAFKESGAPAAKLAKAVMADIVLGGTAEGREEWVAARAT